MPGDAPIIFRVTADDDGKRLDRLVAHGAGISRRVARIWIQQGRVQVGGKVVRLMGRTVRAATSGSPTSLGAGPRTTTVAGATTADRGAGSRVASSVAPGSPGRGVRCMSAGARWATGTRRTAGGPGLTATVTTARRGRSSATTTSATTATGTTWCTTITSTDTT
ncbi:MAG: hypothetical protein IH848_04425 [Acidobacteria bacterium]|nr:hypothetical protein [Acidobacteriota bacterium]